MKVICDLRSEFPIHISPSYISAVHIYDSMLLEFAIGVLLQFTTNVIAIFATNFDKFEILK